MMKMKMIMMMMMTDVLTMLDEHDADCSNDEKSGQMAQILKMMKYHENNGTSTFKSDPNWRRKKKKLETCSKKTAGWLGRGCWVGEQRGGGGEQGRGAERGGGLGRAGEGGEEGEEALCQT